MVQELEDQRRDRWDHLHVDLAVLEPPNLRASDAEDPVAGGRKHTFTAFLKLTKKQNKTYSHYHPMM